VLVLEKVKGAIKMADLVKRIQSRLSRKSISISKQDLTLEIAALGYSPQALQEEEIDTITQLLLDKHLSKELAVSEPEEITAAPSDDYHASTPNSTAITNQQKEQLISVQAQSMGISLNESEITDISQTVSDSFTDFVSAVETINSSIKDYAQNKFDEVEQKIDASNNNLRDYINNRTTSLQRKSVEGAITTKEVLEQKSSNLKSFSKSLSAAFKTK
jgi:predicted amino acid-binding ACT domain protein